jgi:hypothetical protein
MPCPSHPPWLDHYNYTWRRVTLHENMKTRLEVLEYFMRTEIIGRISRDCITKWTCLSKRHRREASSEYNICQEVWGIRLLSHAVFLGVFLQQRQFPHANSW